MDFITISTICFVMLPGSIKPVPIYSDFMQKVYEDRATCIQTASISTTPITAKDGAQNYLAVKDRGLESDAYEELAELSARETDKRLEDRERRLQESQIIIKAEEPTVKNWHCVDWKMERIMTIDDGPTSTRNMHTQCIREEGYGSDGLVHWRQP